jgi:hypothetical protein
MNESKIKHTQFDLQSLVETMLDVQLHPWRKYVEIIPDYMPPYPHKDTRPTVQIRYGEWFLRYSKEPSQNYFWDMYGEDFLSVELALVALQYAPAPPSGKPYASFEFELDSKRLT